MGTTTADMETYWKEEQDEALDTTALKCRPPRTPPPPLPHPNSPEALPVQDDEQELQPQPEKSERSIYFETQDGVTGKWKCNHCTWTYQTGSLQNDDPIQNSHAHHYHQSMHRNTLVHHGTYFSFETKVGTEATDGFGGMKYGAAGHSVAENELGNGESDLTLNGVEVPNSLTTETDYGTKQNPNGEGRSGLPPTYPENGSASRKPVEDPHLRVLDESKQVVAEWDVETVIAEQKTHDLYCPNCKSCITKRVILKKRKRKETLQNGSKRVVQFPSLDQGHETAPLVVDGSPSVDPGDQDRETEPVLFRCFSCFSFFIPSVACFKSLFGDRGDRESARTGAVIEEKKTTTVSAVSPATFPQPGYSHVDEHFSTTKVWNYDQRGQVSSTSVSVHRENTRTNNDDTQMNSSKQTEGGFDAMQDLSTGELSKSLAFSDENLTNENSGSLNTPGSQLPRISDIQEDMSKRFEASLPQDKHDIGKELEGPRPPRGTDAEKKTTTVSAVSPATFPQPGYSHVDEHFSTTKVWNYDQRGQVSSTSVSVHRENTRTNNDDTQMNSSKQTEGGFNAMQDLSTGELSKSLAFSDENLINENSGSLNTPGSQHPRISDIQEDMSKRFEASLPQDKHDIGKELEGPPRGTDAGNEVRVEIREERFSSTVSENSENNINSSRAGTSRYNLTGYRGEQQVDEDKSPIKWDILKSVVYGGLVESITSLGVVSSAAGGGAATLNIIAIGLASLVGGLFMIAHGLVDMKNEQYGRDTTQSRSVDRYQELLGNRRVFKIHVTLAILSYLLFGLVAPVTYCFSFQESDNRDYKLIAVAVASLVCIAILAFSKVYAQQPPKAYFTTVMYYVSMGVMSSGLSFVVGVLVKKLLEDLGWFEPTVVPPPPAVFLEKMAAGYLSSSY